VSTSFKIGIFRASGCFASDGSVGCGWIGEKETAQRLAAAVSGNPALTLGYSNYEQALDIPPMREPDRLWTGSHPNLTAVYSEAAERGLDGVLMYRGDGILSGNIIAQDVPIELYVIDVRGRQVRSYKSMTNTVDEVGQRALSTFLASAQPIAAPGIQRGSASKSYRIGIFPADGLFVRAPGSPWEEEYVAQIFRRHIKADAPSMSLRYSYYDPSLNQPPIYDYTRVWAGTKPRLSAIYREAEVRHLDAVFIYRGNGARSDVYGKIPSDPMPIDLYLIDVKQRRTYAQKGDTDALEKMVQGLISRLLQGQAQVAASTRPTSAAKARTPKRTNSAPYNIAIFPFDSDSNCIGWGRVRHEKLAAELETLIRRNDSLKLVYSYYDEQLDRPLIKDVERLWPIGSKKPNMTETFSLAETRGADAVVMYWRSDPDAGIVYCGTKMPPFPVDVYLIDIKQRRTYKLNGHEENLSALVEETFSRFLAGAQPKVVATAQKSGLTAGRSAPYKIAVFPFAGQFGGNSSWHREYKVAELLQVRIQQDPLLELAYSYYDDALNYPRIADRDRPWHGPKPNVDLVYQMASERSVDAVVMAFGDFIDFWSNGGWGGPSGFAVPVRIYVVDVARRKVYFEKGTAESESVKEKVDALLSQFLRTHSTAMRKTVSGDERPAPVAQ
jgi:hypothetical protein